MKAVYFEKCFYEVIVTLTTFFFLTRKNDFATKAGSIYYYCPKENCSVKNCISILLTQNLINIYKLIFKIFYFERRKKNLFFYTDTITKLTNSFIATFFCHIEAFWW